MEGLGEGILADMRESVLMTDGGSLIGKQSQAQDTPKNEHITCVPFSVNFTGARDHDLYFRELSPGGKQHVTGRIAALFFLPQVVRCRCCLPLGAGARIGHCLPFASGEHIPFFAEMKFSSLIFLPLAATAFSPGTSSSPRSMTTSTSLHAAAENSASLSARDARIKAPLSAVTASLVAAGLPASLAVNPQAASAVTEYSAFELSCRQYFPASLPNSKVAERVIRTLKARGYQPDNTLLASSLCSDEINDTDLSLFSGLQNGLTKTNSGGVFNLGGLGGVPFVGPSGFGAFFSHSPKDGHIVIVYGPHVGISADGVVGKVERVGMDKPSGACGAALGAYKAIKAEREKQLVSDLAGTQLEGFPYEATQPDVQEDFIIRDLRARMEREDLDGPDQNALIAMVTNKMYDMVSDLLLREVDGAIKKPGFWQGVTEVTLLGGLVINRGNPDGRNRVEDYFKPITFQVS